MDELQEISPADNVLLEHRMALELRELGLVEFIMPVFVGDVLDGTRHTFSAWSHGSSCVVAAVEQKLKLHLSNQSLGEPVLEQQGAKTTLSTIFQNQGCFYNSSQSLEQVADKITLVVRKKTPSITIEVQEVQAVPAAQELKEEVIRLRLELQQMTQWNAALAEKVEILTRLLQTT